MRLPSRIPAQLPRRILQLGFRRRGGTSGSGAGPYQLVMAYRRELHHPPTGGRKRLYLIRRSLHLQYRWTKKTLMPPTIQCEATYTRCSLAEMTFQCLLPSGGCNGWARRAACPPHQLPSSRACSRAQAVSIEITASVRMPALRWLPKLPARSAPVPMSAHAYSPGTSVSMGTPFDIDLQIDILNDTGNGSL